MAAPAGAEAILKKIVAVCLVFLLVVIPLIVNPTAMDYWYKPKIDSIYALLIITAIALLLRRAIYRRTMPFSRTPLTIPLCAYGVSAVISTVVSIAPEKSIYGDMWREEGIFTLLSYIGLTFVFSSLVETEKELQSLIKGLLAAAFLVSLYGLVQYAGFNPTEHFVPQFRGAFINSTMGNANFLGKFIVLMLPLFFSYLLIASDIRMRLVYAVGIIVLCCALVLTFTRASWLACAASLCILGLCARAGTFAISMRAAMRSGAIVLLGTGLLLWGIITYSPRGQSFFIELKADVTGAFDLAGGTGSATRLFVWKKTAALILERPLFGYGPDAHVRAMRRFNLEYNKKFNNWVIIDRAHNNYLDITVAQGLIGLAAYLWIVVTFLFWLRQTIRQETRRDRKIVYIGIFSAVCGYLINDIFIFSVVSVSPTFWSLLGLSFSLKKLETP